ncbi:hypothetical protein G3M58_40270 [Streptomyces sp. SID7499]|uniref:Homing endonuclease LAGLIDADG domain-containing protein n=1 Tax=Streptomyces sp. SID7499 TaxID=2706086 RepID=A0A6G3X4U2_9ACTN|nr:hypothetical protein [Streptomyces sp. SID7499]
MADCEPSAHQFMDLTVPEYAYMFGFLQADGHLARGTGQKGRLTVEINARDVGLLSRFQELTPYYSSVTKRTRSTNFAATHSSATWSLCSLEARTKLNDLGLPYGRKSAEITPPRVDFSERDYLRGIIDADGSVGYTSLGFPFVSLTTTSTAIGTYLCFHAEKLTGAKRTIKRNTRDGIYNIVYMKEHAQELAAHLYYPDCLSLERKQVAADSLGGWARPADMGRRPPRIHWTSEMDRILLAAPTIAHAAAELGYSRSPCQNRRWKLLHGVVPRPD